MTSQRHGGNKLSTAHVNLEQLENFVWYGVLRIERDESIPPEMLAAHKDGLGVSVHPSSEAKVRALMEEAAWKKRSCADSIFKRSIDPCTLDPIGRAHSTPQRQGKR
jgi:hypothetical protein